MLCQYNRDAPNLRAPAERNVECYLREMKLMMEGQNPSINRTHGSTLVILLVCGYIPQDLVCENLRLHKSIMRKMSWILTLSFLNPESPES